MGIQRNRLVAFLFITCELEINKKIDVMAGVLLA